MHWGKWIATSFVLFAAFIGTLAYYCMKENISLVSEEYYKDELAFQDLMEKQRRTLGLAQQPQITVASGVLVLQFHQERRIENGNLMLFRPSDNRYDKVFVLDNTPEEQFDVKTLPAGMYKAKLRWTMEGKDFYWEDIINL